MAARQVLLGEAGKDHTVEFDHLIAQKLEHTAHDAVLAGVDGDAHVLARIVHILHLIGNDDAVVELKAIAKGSHIDVGEVLVEFHVIGLLNLGRGMGEFLGQVAVVGEEQQTGGVAVEAAYGIDAFFAGVAHQLHHVGAVALVVGSGDVVFGLVEQHIDRFFALQHLVAVAHLIGGHHLVAHLGHHLAVDGDGTGGDEHVGIAARADAGIGNVFVKADRTVLFFKLQGENSLLLRTVTTLFSAAVDDFGQNLRFGRHVAATGFLVVLKTAFAALEVFLALTVVIRPLLITLEGAFGAETILFIVIKTAFRTTGFVERALGFGKITVVVITTGRTAVSRFSLRVRVVVKIVFVEFSFH